MEFVLYIENYLVTKHDVFGIEYMPELYLPGSFLLQCSIVLIDADEINRRSIQIFGSTLKNYCKRQIV